MNTFSLTSKALDNPRRVDIPLKSMNLNFYQNIKKHNVSKTDHKFLFGKTFTQNKNLT